MDEEQRQVQELNGDARGECGIGSMARIGLAWPGLTWPGLVCIGLHWRLDWTGFGG